MTYSSRKLYRSRNGMLLGVCQGIADWRDMPVSVVRLIVVIITLATAVAPCLIIYLIAGFMLPLEPRGYGSGPRRSTMDDIKDQFDDLKSRVNRMEDEETGDKESDWDRRFHNGK